MSIAQHLLAGSIKALNTGGRVLRRIGVERPRLETGPLIDMARRRSGHWKLGEWAIEEPLERLLASYREEADLTALGRLTVRELIVSQLETLLHLEAELRDNPAIAEERIESPVFIIGLPRTGTTLLHGLMSQDPANRVPLTWEVMYPAAYPNTPAGIEAARKRTASRLTWANRLAPKFRKIHPIAADLPQECIAITAHVFMSIQFHTTHDVPGYENWFERDSQQLAYAYHRRLLQHLQARNPGRRWVLKAPGHLFALDALLREYPDARIVQTHRDPLRVMASMASHATVLRRAFSDTADPATIAADWSDRWARALNDFLAIRDRARPESFLDVSYEQIEQSPFDTIAGIYDFLGRELEPAAEQAMQAFLAANPKNKHGVHRYSLAEYGLSPVREMQRFEDYCARFNIAVQTDA